MNHLSTVEQAIFHQLTEDGFSANCRAINQSFVGSPYFIVIHNPPNTTPVLGVSLLDDELELCTVMATAEMPGGFPADFVGLYSLHDADFYEKLRADIRAELDARSLTKWHRRRRWTNVVRFFRGLWWLIGGGRE